MEDQNHLTANEIIEFVTLDQLNADSKKLLTRVNKHIRKCQKCFEFVKSYQILYDELNSQKEQQPDFKRNIAQAAAKMEEINRVSIKAARAMIRASRRETDPKGKKSYN